MQRAAGAQVGGGRALGAGTTAATVSDAETAGAAGCSKEQGAAPGCRCQVEPAGPQDKQFSPRNAESSDESAPCLILP